MDTKFDGILTNEDKDIIVSILSVINLSEKQKLNLIESIMTVTHKYSDYFTNLTSKEKLEAVTFLLLIFDTLLDAEINPLASKTFLKGLSYFNNNIFGEIKGGASHV